MSMDFIRIVALISSLLHYGIELKWLDPVTEGLHRGNPIVVLPYTEALQVANKQQQNANITLKKTYKNQHGCYN